MPGVENESCVCMRAGSALPLYMSMQPQVLSSLVEKGSLHYLLGSATILPFVEVGSSILPSPTKAYSIPDKESDKPFSLPKTLKTGVGTKLGTEDSENSSANVSLGWIIVRLTSQCKKYLGKLSPAEFRRRNPNGTCIIALDALKH